MEDIIDTISFILASIMAAIGSLGPAGSFMVFGVGSVALVWMVSRAMRI